ncbi:MAG: M14 family zinc carboxypeptidase [Cyclobacteriaceae bacterium]
MTVPAQFLPVPLAAYESHEKYREPTITHRRFKHRDIEPLLLALRDHPAFQVTRLGESIEGRAIYDVSFGRGETTVLLWSQMHGDETTATMAGLDLFNFFAQSDELDPLRKQILDHLNIHFVPMLNPDGAEQFQRRNAIDMDLNRDALRRQSPESQILKHLRDSLQADFGFNLHDQSTYYTAGVNAHPATISFLAPAYNYEKEVNDVRKRALQLVVLLNNAIQDFIPQQVACYNDDFEPRAFGDNMQKWGSSTVLIESGGYTDDPEKQQIRKINYVLLLTGLHAIAEKNYQKAPVEAYHEIPENERYLYDLVVRNVQREKNGQYYTVDVGINREDIDFDDHQQYYYLSSIQDIGDLSTYYGYQEFNARAMVAVPGKVYEKTLKDIEAVAALDAKQLLRQGYTTVRVRRLNQGRELRASLLLDVITRTADYDNALLLGNRPNFILKKGNKALYAVVNGVLIEL